MKRAGHQVVALRNSSKDPTLDYLHNYEDHSPRFDKGLANLQRASEEFKRRCEDSKLYAQDQTSYSIRLMPFRPRSNPATGDRFNMSSSAGGTRALHPNSMLEEFEK